MDDLLGASWLDRGPDLLHDAVDATVERTLATGSPLVGEELAARLYELDEEYDLVTDADEHCSCCPHYDYDPPSDRATLQLVGRLMTARRNGAGAALAGQVLDWVEARLGRRGGVVELRARHLGAPASPRPDVPTPIGDVLDDDIAVLVWLVSGLAAVSSGDDGGRCGRTDVGS